MNCEYVSGVFFLQELVVHDVQSMSAIIIGTLIRQLYTISFDCIYTGTSLFKIMICRYVGKIDIIQVCRKQVAVKNGGKKSSTLLPQLQWYKPNIPYTQAASPRFETNTG